MPGCEKKIIEKSWRHIQASKERKRKLASSGLKTIVMSQKEWAIYTQTRLKTSQQEKITS